jgi:hypothetical protein
MDTSTNNTSSFWLKPKTVFITFFVVLNTLNIASVISDRINVWKIFTQGFFHLIGHKDLYAFYPQEYFDSYLYSPSFAAMFAPFSLLPNYVGYFLWNNISMLLVPYLIFKFKGITENKKALICYIALIEMATCMQGTQTNVMIAALMLLSFLSFENKNYWMAAFATAIGFYIKIYPIVMAGMFLLYPDKLKFIGKLIVAFLVIGALPLLFIKPVELDKQYESWVNILVLDQSDNYGKISLTGLVQVYFNASDLGKLLVQIFGVFVFCLMYVRYKLFKSYYYRLYFLYGTLLWVVLFNHASEIYGYAIAILEIGLWYATKPSSKKLNIFICLFILFATVLSIDSTPRFISKYIYEHALKALPYTVMFGVIVWQMLAAKPSDLYNNIASDTTP